MNNDVHEINYQTQMFICLVQSVEQNLKTEKQKIFKMKNVFTPLSHKNQWRISKLKKKLSSYNEGRVIWPKKKFKNE